MDRSINPHVDALTWAERFYEEPDLRAKAFTYRSAKELMVLIPQENEYLLRRFNGNWVGEVLVFTV